MTPVKALATLDRAIVISGRASANWARAYGGTASGRNRAERAERQDAQADELFEKVRAFLGATSLRGEP